MALALTRFPGQSLFFSGPSLDAILDLLEIQNGVAKVSLTVNDKPSRWMIADGECVQVSSDVSVQFRIFSSKVRMAIAAPKEVRVVREEALEPSMSI